MTGVQVMKKNLFVVIISLMIISACQPSTSPQIVSNQPKTSTVSSQSTITVVIVKPTKTRTPAPTETIAPTSTPMVTPTAIGGGSGRIIYSDGWTLYSVSTDGMQKRTLSDNCSWNWSISPDSRYMVCSEYNIDKRSPTGLVLIDLETQTVVKQLLGDTVVNVNNIDNGSYVRDVWSPDSTQIAVSTTFENKTGVFLVNIKNFDVHFLYETPNDTYVRWSPDGKKILLYEQRMKQKEDYYYYLLINSDGTNLKTIDLFDFGGRTSNNIKWEMDKNTIYVNGQSFDLDTAKLTGNEPVDDRFDFLKGFFFIMNGDGTSPDGNYEIGYGLRDNKGYLLKIKEAQKIDITKKLSFSLVDTGVEFSPNSKYFAAYDHKKGSITLFSMDTLTASHLLEVNRDNKQKNDSFLWQYDDLFWLPDSNHIIFRQADMNGGLEIGSIDLSGNVTYIASTQNFGNMIVQPEIK
jgi:hypothetical protein